MQSRASLRDVDGSWFRCWCCGLVLTVDRRCPLCEMAGLTSPPHLCLVTGELLSDEAGSAPHLQPVEPDHETRARHRSA